MEKTYVYVLSIESVTRGEPNDLVIEVFGSVEHAKARLEEEYNKDLKEWQSWCDPDYLEHEIYESKKHAQINELYNTCNNHVFYSIEQKEIQ